MRCFPILLFSLLFIGLLGEARAELLAMHLQSWAVRQPANTGAGVLALQLQAEPVQQKSMIGKACAKLHTVVFRSQLISFRVDTTGQFLPGVENWIGDAKAKQWIDIPNKILSDWQNVHQYTTPEKIEALRFFDQSLSPLRTSYSLFESGADRAGIRVFDGSTHIYKDGFVWGEASRTDSRLPIERIDKDLKLPERESGNARIVEIGLLDVTSNVSQGMRWAFGKVAQYLDNTHNRMSFMAFGKVKDAQDRKLKVYAQTRKEQVALFERFGLLPVLDAQGDMVILSSGLVLMAADGGTFIQKNFIHQILPQMKDQKQEGWSLQGTLAQMKAQHDYMNGLDANKLQITSRQELVDMGAAMIRLLDSARTYSPGSQGHGERLTLFLSTYFRVINSLPVEMRSRHWEQMRMTLLHVLSQADPQAAYLTLWMHFNPDKIQGSVTPDFEARFFQQMPNIPTYFGEINY